MEGLKFSDWLEMAIGKTEIELTKKEFIEILMLMPDAVGSNVDLNNPVIMGVKIKIKKE